MTVEKAVEILERMQQGKIQEIREAFDMAIEALREKALREDDLK